MYILTLFPVTDVINDATPYVLNQPRELINEHVIIYARERERE